MYEFYPLLTVGAVVGVISVIFILAYFSIKDRKEAIGFDRNMKDSEIIKRLMQYAKPHAKSFILVMIIMLFSIAYDIISPTLIGNVEEMIKGDFEYKSLISYVIVYALILAVSLVSTYVQAIMLQKIGLNKFC